MNASAEGDTIELAEGVFRGPGNRDVLLIERMIVIRSEGGAPEGCILDCEGSQDDPHRAFHISGMNGHGPFIQGITIRNGWGSPAGPFSQLVGGALVLEGAAARFERCVFQGNHGEDDAGAVFCYESNPVFLDCDFVGNTSEVGGAVLVSTFSTPEFERCDFDSNTATTFGGAVHLFQSTPKFRDCVFRGNSALNGGAIAALFNETAYLQECVFLENTADTRGGAIYLLGSGPSIAGCVMSENQAGDSGGAIYCGGYSVPQFKNCTFVRNSSPTGGGIHGNGEASVLTVTKCILAFGVAGGAVSCAGGAAAYLVCCDLYGNSGGDWSDCIEGQLGVGSNINADPLFCNLDGGDYHLQVESPCSPDSALCGWGLVGALAVGCEVPLTAHGPGHSGLSRKPIPTHAGR